MGELGRRRHYQVPASLLPRVRLLLRADPPGGNGRRHGGAKHRRVCRHGKDWRNSPSCCRRTCCTGRAPTVRCRLQVATALGGGRTRRGFVRGEKLYWSGWSASGWPSRRPLHAREIPPSTARHDDSATALSSSAGTGPVQIPAASNRKPRSWLRTERRSDDFSRRRPLGLLFGGIQQSADFGGDTLTAGWTRRTARCLRGN